MSDPTEKGGSNPAPLVIPPLKKKPKPPKGRPFQKGQPSANPGGRPKGLAARVRELTLDGKLVVDQMFKIWLGVEKGFGPRERMEAGKWLADRGHGKETQTTVQIDASLEQIEEASDLSDAALESLARGLKVVDRPSDAPSAKDAATEETGLPLKVAK